jgi:hypothetical protein
VSAVLKGSTPGHFEESPPWDIKWEPGGGKFFVLKRPFEAKEVDGAGYTSHYKNEPGHTKIKSDQQCHKDQISHIPLALHLSPRSAVEIAKHSGLEPEQEDGV